MIETAGRPATGSSAVPGARPAFGGDVRTTNLDLVLAVVVALGLPLLCAALLGLTGGALASLYVYYVLACVVLVRWRKGTLDYRRPERWPWALFVAGLLVFAAITANNWTAYPDYGAAPLGLALTVLIWAPLNGAMEQLSWVYVLDAWRNRWPSGWRRVVGQVVGWLLILTLVALIHILFWTLFLPAKAPSELWWIDQILNVALTVVYVLLYDRSRSMWPTFIIHTLVDLQLVLLANYSILPSL
jgi:membrane protease YdiL (CAAX protease family)